MNYYTHLALTWGTAVACIDAEGQLAGLWFEGQKYFPKIPEEAVWIDPAPSPAHVVNPVVQKTLNALKIQLAAYEHGALTQFDLPLAPKGTPFQQEIWKLLMNIPLGETITYGALAKRAAQALGKSSMSAQAVGQAIGHNPISVIIPCHRVIGANGKLTGYAGGIDKKMALLRHEGVLN